MATVGFKGLIKFNQINSLSHSLIPGQGACHGPDRLQEGPHASRVESVTSNQLDTVTA